MKRTLQDHLDWLKARQNDITSELMTGLAKESSNYLESELRTIQLEIAYYESAIKLNGSSRRGKEEPKAATGTD